MSDPVRSPIQVAASRSGLSAHVIRVWERRYRAVEPERDEGGRRFYSEEEIERLRLLREATEAGHAIGTIARLERDRLVDLVARARPAHPVTATGGDDTAGEVRRACFDAVRQLHSAALDAALQRGLVRFGHQGLLQRIVSPLAVEIGDAWRAGTLTAAHEHFFTAAAKIFLGSLSRQFAMHARMPNLVVGTPAGQLHELGAFMAGVSAAHLGWRVTYLGAGLPAAEIAGAASQCRAAAVALSIVYPADDPQLPEELRSLRRLLPPEIGILVGGAAAPSYGPVLAEIGAIRSESLEDFTAVLDRMRSSGARPGAE